MYLYLNENSLKKIEEFSELTELTHEDDPLLNKNNTTGFLNKITGKAKKIQNNRDILAGKIREFRKRRDNSKFFINNFKNHSARSEKSYNYFNNVLNGFKSDPSYYLRTGFLPNTISNRQSTQMQSQPAFAQI